MIKVGDIVRFSNEARRMGFAEPKAYRNTARKRYHRSFTKPVQKLLKVIQVFPSEYHWKNPPGKRFNQIVVLADGRSISTGWLRFVCRPYKSNLRRRTTD